MKNTGREELLKYKLTFLNRSSIFNEDIKRIRTKCGFLLKGYPYSLIKIKSKFDKKYITRNIFSRGRKFFKGKTTYLETDIDIDKEIEILRKKFKLSYYFDQHLLNYILFSDFDFSDITIPVSIVTEESFKEPQKDDRIMLEITSQTRLEDLIEIWPEIKSIQKEYNSFIGASKLRNEKIVERDEFIFKLYRDGISSKVIIDEVANKFIPENSNEEEIINLEKMYRLDESNIRRIISRMKNSMTS